MKLLIIDDNPSVRATLKVILADRFDTIAAVGDPTLIPALLEPVPDAVLLDMNFDNASFDGNQGLFWLGRIKSLPRPPAVVAITAFGEVALAVTAMKQGADDFVTKPWDNTDLRTRLDNAIAKNRLLRAEHDRVRQAREIERLNTEREQMSLDQVKAAHARETLKRLNGNLSAAAARLGINRQTLYNLLKKQ